MAKRPRVRKTPPPTKHTSMKRLEGDHFAILDKDDRVVQSISFGDVRIYHSYSLAKGLCTDPTHRVARVILCEVP